MAEIKSNQIPRPPVVAVMGHVDHGKTTLLDYIRNTNLAAREAGGITQAIGAYEITRNGRLITFIDTPGHEAFSHMRAHGAKCADIAMLVVAADDSVKPQTKEALASLQAAAVPFVVAITKTDKPGANIEKVKQDLAQIGVFLEGYGGAISWHAVSGKSGEGVSDLLDLVLLAADLEHPTYDPASPATGIVLTARLDPRRGIVVGAVLENGTLRRGNFIATPSARGKVKMLENLLGKPAPALSPSAPALIVGFESLPEIGEAFVAGTTPPVVAAPPKKVSVSRLPAEGDHVPLILKADEAAGLQALEGVVQKLSANIPLVVVSKSVGDVYESDVKTAESVGAAVVGFRTKTDRAAQNLARAKKIMLIGSSVIYELEKEIARYAEKLVAKAMRTIEVLAIFGEAKGKQHIVGGRVTLGPVRNQESFEIWQEKKLIGKGRILNLQSERQDVSEAIAGQEVGLLVESDEPIAVGNRLLFADPDVV